MAFGYCDYCGHDVKAYGHSLPCQEVTRLTSERDQARRERDKLKLEIRDWREHEKRCMEAAREGKVVVFESACALIKKIVEQAMTTPTDRAQFVANIREQANRATPNFDYDGYPGVLEVAGDSSSADRTFATGRDDYNLSFATAARGGVLRLCDIIAELEAELAATRGHLRLALICADSHQCSGCSQEGLPCEARNAPWTTKEGNHPTTIDALQANAVTDNATIAELRAKLAEEEKVRKAAEAWEKELNNGPLDDRGDIGALNVIRQCLAGRGPGEVE